MDEHAEAFVYVSFMFKFYFVPKCSQSFFRGKKVNKIIRTLCMIGGLAGIILSGYVFYTKEQTVAVLEKVKKNSVHSTDSNITTY